MIEASAVVQPLRKLTVLLLALLGLAAGAAADESSARAAMENPGNPLLQITTGAGEIFVEMLASEAPQNVEHVLALAAGEIEIADRQTGQLFTPRYYDGMRFHRIIPGLLIQAGSPSENAFGEPPALLADEINANSLGLDLMSAVLPDGSFNPLLQIEDHEDLEQILLTPLYRAMGIGSESAIVERQFEIDQRLRQLTLKQVYENLGYRYTDRHPTRPVVRGTVGLANSGPDSNSSEFFIALATADWLNGRYTVIGRVVEGMEVVERINQQSQARFQNPATALIYSVRAL